MAFAIRSAYCLPVRRLIGQRNGGAEHIGWIVKPLGLDQPFGVATVAFRSARPLTPCKKVGVSARKCHRVESPARVLRPLPVSLLLEAVGSIGEASKNLDQHVLAAKAEGGDLQGNARRGAPEGVGNDRAARRNRVRHRVDHGINAAVIDRGKPARLHEHALPIDDMRGEYAQSVPAGHGAHGRDKRRSELAKRRDARLSLFRRTAPGRQRS